VRWSERLLTACTGCGPPSYAAADCIADHDAIDGTNDSAAATGYADAEDVVVADVESDTVADIEPNVVADVESDAVADTTAVVRLNGTRADGESERAQLRRGRPGAEFDDQRLGLCGAVHRDLIEYGSRNGGRLRSYRERYGGRSGHRYGHRQRRALLRADQRRRHDDLGHDPLIRRSSK
jgi:hypothetical protein